MAATAGGAFGAVADATQDFIGVVGCRECHNNIVTTQAQTAHGSAFSNARFAADGGQTRSACLPCHTVGYGTPTGFISLSATPQLKEVQCENCHGAAASHAANPDDPVARPSLALSPSVCGQCHDGPWHPTFSEWTASPHTRVVEDMNTPEKFDSCGRCHSGLARLALLEGEPLLTGDANIGIVCATCHDPHETNAYPALLRNPIASTRDYFITASGVFTNQYQADINICAQCHNHRGASWTDSSRAPHRSLQYNMLLGTVGESESGLPPRQPASHALLIEKQCVGCHMQQSNHVSAAQPAITGHKFTVDSYDLCQSCHTNQTAALVEFVQGDISDRVLQVKASLDWWATNKAPAALATNYGIRAWEYTTPGDLSAAGPGPSSSEQALISTNIQKARFDLYLVYHDGSFGVHNGPYAVKLLNTAMSWVTAEIGGAAGGAGGGSANSLALEPPAALQAASTNTPGTVGGNAGSYSGLFWDATQAAAESSGFITVKITPRSSYTGRLLLEGKSYAFSGRSIPVSGLFTNYILTPSRHVLAVRLQVDLTGGRKVHGTVSDWSGNWTTEVVAARDGASAPAGLRGKAFTLAVPPAESGPAGFSYGTIQIDASGNLHWAGALADGSKVSQSVRVSEQGLWPLMASLYGGGGMAIGWMQLNTNDLNGKFIWLKNGGLAGKYTNTYAAGITNSVWVDGSPYVAPAGTGRVLNLTNAAVNLSGGGLTNAFAEGFALGANRRVATKDNHLRLRFTTSSGLFSGSAVNPETGGTISFQGVVNQKAINGAGWFMGKQENGRVFLAPTN